MGKPQIRLSQSTIDAVNELSERCAIADLDTLLSLLIRKYGGRLVEVLAPYESNRPPAATAVANTPPKVADIATPITPIATNGSKPPPIAWDD